MNTTARNLLGLLGATALLLATPGCLSGDTDGSGSAALQQNQTPNDRETDQEGPGRRGRRGRGGPEGPEIPGEPDEPPPPPEEEPWPPHPGGDFCEELFAELDICHQIHGEICGEVHEDLARCHETQFLPCEGLIQQYFDCETAGGGANCEPLRVQAEACFDGAHQICADLENASNECYAPCWELEEQIHVECELGPECPPGPIPEDTCGLLDAALWTCHQQQPPELCITIEAALVTVCGGAQGPEPFPEEPPPYPEDEPEEEEEPGRPPEW